MECMLILQNKFLISVELGMFLERDKLHLGLEIMFQTWYVSSVVPHISWADLAASCVRRDEES